MQVGADGFPIQLAKARDEGGDIKLSDERLGPSLEGTVNFHELGGELIRFHETMSNEEYLKEKA